MNGVDTEMEESCRTEQQIKNTNRPRGATIPPGATDYVATIHESPSPLGRQGHSASG